MMVMTIMAASVPRTARATEPPLGDTVAESAADAEEESAGRDAVVVVGTTLLLSTRGEVYTLGVTVERADTRVEEVEEVTAVGVSFVEVVLFGMGVLTLV